MSRAIIAAPVDRDLWTEYDGRAWRIPNATNGVLQAWCTNEREFFAALPVAERQDCTWYTRRADVPAALRPYLIVVLRVSTRNGDPATATPKQLGLCGTSDFFRVRSSTDVISVKLRSEMVAGDRPVDWSPVHRWFGVADDLGDE
jgi:hypothetical protein